VTVGELLGLGEVIPGLTVELPTDEPMTLPRLQNGITASVPSLFAPSKKRSLNVASKPLPFHHSFRAGNS